MYVCVCVCYGNVMLLVWMRRSVCPCKQAIRLFKVCVCMCVWVFVCFMLYNFEGHHSGDFYHCLLKDVIDIEEYQRTTTITTFITMNINPKAISPSALQAVSLPSTRCSLSFIVWLLLSDMRYYCQHTSFHLFHGDWICSFTFLTVSLALHLLPFGHHEHAWSCEKHKICCL